MTAITTTRNGQEITVEIDENGNVETFVYQDGEMPEELDQRMVEIFGERPTREER